MGIVSAKLRGAAEPQPTLRWLRLLVTCLALPLVAPLFVSPADALDQVSLQLKWKHQFQFAGYYAAVEKGFYRENGLDVAIREGGSDINAGAAVAAGSADFGICTTSILLNSATRANNVVLAVIFQNSAAVILTPHRAGIRSVSDLKGRRLMDRPGNDDLAAMLKHEGVDYASLPRVLHDGNPRDLLNGTADAMVAYSTNEPYALEKLGTPYLTFSPRAFGLDFYGDSLCTSRQQLAAHPERVRAFRAASLKGWEYALAHKDEIVDLIRQRYRAEKSREALMFEATRTEPLIQPDLIPIGDQSSARWKTIADAYVELGMASEAALPDGFTYSVGDSGWWAWLQTPLLAGLFTTVLVYALGRTLYRRKARALGAMRLSLVMSGVFVLLSIPVLIFILTYNYRQNAAAINATLRDVVAKTKQASIEDVQNLIDPVAATLTLLAAVAAEDPEAFRKEESRDLLYRALTSARQIDATYVSFEDGYHRVVTRIDDDRRRSDPKIPPSANWHSSYIDAFSGSPRRVRHRTFFDTWPDVAGSYDAEQIMDIRTLRGYQAAKEARALIVEEPSVNPDTGSPVIAVRYPIIKDGTFLGCASAHLTLDVLSRFLVSHRASPHSVTVIANPAKGTIIAHPDLKKSVRVENDRLELTKLDTIADENVREAYRLQRETNSDDFFFNSPRDGARDQRVLHPLSGQFWTAVGDHHPHPDRRLCRHSQAHQPANDLPDRRPDRHGVAIDLCLRATAVASDRRRVARIAIGRGSDVLARRAAVVEDQGNQGAAKRRVAVRDLAAVVLLVRTSGRGQRADQNRHSPDARRRTALYDNSVRRSEGFLHPRRADGTKRSAEPALRILRGSIAGDCGRARHGRQVHWRWHHGVLGCARPSVRSRALRMPWRRPRSATHARTQRGMGRAGAPAIAPSHRVTLRRRAGWKCRFERALELHGDGRRG